VATDTVSLTSGDGPLRGYAEIGGASLILGTSGALLQISTMPASLLLVLRMALAGLVLAPFFLLTGGVAEVRRSGRFWRLVLIGVTVACELLFYFASIRLANVAIGIALEYMAPVYIALVAPWVLHTRREHSDMVAVAIAALGMALIVLPSLTLAGSRNLVPGVACGIVAGAFYATALLLIKGIGPGIRGTTFTLFFCVCTVVLMAPLAVWQSAAGHYRLTWTDVAIVVVMGLVYTALCFSLFTDGLRFVAVEHAGILGYLEPVTAPLWALLLVGERPPLSTWLGGALIIAAGIFAIALGRAETEMPA
jgi:drug/metabolite transporter (DMT)-like permease